MGKLSKLEGIEAIAISSWIYKILTTSFLWKKSNTWNHPHSLQLVVILGEKMTFPNPSFLASLVASFAEANSPLAVMSREKRAAEDWQRAANYRLKKPDQVGFALVRSTRQEGRTSHAWTNDPVWNTPCCKLFRSHPREAWSQSL